MEAFETGLEHQRARIEVVGLDEQEAEQLRAIFDRDDEDVIFSHAFGGVDIVTILTTLGGKTLEKLAGFFAARQLKKYEAKLKIGSRSIEMSGFTMEEMRALLASDEMKRTIKSLR